VHIHREEEKKGHEMISDPMDLPVGCNPNFDLLVKDIWAGFFCFFGFYSKVCHLLSIVGSTKLREIDIGGGSV